MPMMFETARARARAARRGARLSRRARHALADERCAVERAGWPSGRERARRHAADLQSPLGRPGDFAQLGSIPAREVADLTRGRLREDVPVALNRLATEYDHVLICGPVFPHEVAGFSGGTKYLFPGIAAPEIIHFTHWLGALITSYEVIGTIDTPVRAVIDRAAALLDTPMSLLALVVSHRRRGGHVLRRRARGVAAGRDAVVAASYRLGGRALRSRARDHAGDVRRSVDGRAKGCTRASRSSPTGAR